MLSCWAQEPKNRPPMDTLQQDLDDFETAVEAKYSDYEHLVPKYETAKRPGKKGGDREKKIQKRKKKAK